MKAQERAKRGDLLTCTLLERADMSPTHEAQEIPEFEDHILPGSFLPFLIRRYSTNIVGESTRSRRNRHQRSLQIFQ